MAPTIPVSKTLVLSGLTAEDFIDDYQSWWSANGGNFSFTSVQGAPVTSFIANNISGAQIKYRMSGGELLSHVSKDGGFVDSSIAETPVGASPEGVLLPVFAGTSAVANISLFDDAIFVKIKDTAGTGNKYSFLHGKGLGLTSIKANGPTGYIVLAYIPSPLANTTAFGFFCTSPTALNRKSWVQITATEWANPALRVTSLEAGTSPGDGSRFSQELVVAGSNGDTPSTSDVSRGFLKYIFGDSAASVPSDSVIPDTTSNQGMMAFRDTSANTRMRVLWNKQETP